MPEIGKFQGLLSPRVCEVLSLLLIVYLLYSFLSLLISSILLIFLMAQPNGAT